MKGKHASSIPHDMFFVVNNCVESGMDLEFTYKG